MITLAVSFENFEVCQIRKSGELLAMFKTFLRAALLSATVSFLAASGATAAMPIPTSATLLPGQGHVIPITFWAQPYPYRYVPWRRCPLVRVETPYGWYMDRVCAPLGPVLRRAY